MIVVGAVPEVLSIDNQLAGAGDVNWAAARKATGAPVLPTEIGCGGGGGPPATVCTVVNGGLIVRPAGGGGSVTVSVTVTVRPALGYSGKDT
ncbi:MAG: hypothetical protein ACKV22_25130 [Bryobacteraceae bacterium]